MQLNTDKLSLMADLAKGAITSLRINGKERLAAESALFRVQLCNAQGERILYSSLDASTCEENENSAVFSGFGEKDVRVHVFLGAHNGETDFRIKATPASSEHFVEWVEFPSVTLPKPIDNDPVSGGKILFPYNEGALVSDMDCREESMFPYREPIYPSMGSYAMFPNMVCSQMLAYLWEDAGLYIGAHDDKRGVKDINFLKTENGVTLRFRLFTGVDFGESFVTDYPIVFSVTEGKWEAAAERYRNWFESSVPMHAKKVKDNETLPEWYEDSPLVVSYPVRGIHDTDEMTPNKLYPYTNALPILEEIREATDARLLVLLMHWEGTAPWAPPYVWPPFGGTENFNIFKQKLHQSGDMLGVYCSGFGYTAQSNLIASYNRMEDYEKRELVSGMCADADGKVKISQICTDQRSGFDICPVSKVGRKLLDEAYAELLSQDIDYVQILDQNHGGGQYFCYNKNHSHAPCPGPWMTEKMQEMLADWNICAGKTLLGCESAAAEPFIGNLLYSDNRYELNYQIGIPVPLYAYVYHEYLRNFMGNQVACPFDTKTDTIRRRLAYSFAAGDSMTLVITPDGDIMTHWGTRDFVHLPNKEKTLRFIKNLMRVYKTCAKKYLYAGRMIEAPKVECESITYARQDSERKIILPAIASSAWEASDGTRALILVNPEDRDIICRVSGEKAVVPALCAIVKEL